MRPPLPPRRAGAAYSIAVVCLGNICRSPVAAVVLEHELDAAGLSDEVRVVSAGTGDWHLGQPMDDRAAATLTARDLDPSGHRASQFDASWFARVDLVLAMDQANRRDICALAASADDAARVLMFRDFDPRAGDDRDVPDPYNGGPEGYRLVLEIVERTAAELVRRLRSSVTSQVT